MHMLVHQEAVESSEMLSDVLSRTASVLTYVGYSAPKNSTTTEVATQNATTYHGLTLRAFSSSESKYLINPAAEWNPSLFLFFGIGLREAY